MVKTLTSCLKMLPEAEIDSNFMYQSNRSFNIPLGIPRAFNASSCPGGREFDYQSLVVGNLIASLNVMLRVKLIARGSINSGGDGEDKL